MNSLEQALLTDLQERTDNALRNLVWSRDHSRYNKTEWRKITNRLDKVRQLLNECQMIGMNIKD